MGFLSVLDMFKTCRWSAMPQLYKLFSLVATIGATSAGVERSFSCLKRLKSYTGNTMGQGRLSSLALLAIERTPVIHWKRNLVGIHRAFASALCSAKGIESRIDI